MAKTKPALRDVCDRSVLALAAKKAFKYVQRREWYDDHSDSAAFMARLNFHVRDLSQDVAFGIYEPEPKVVFRAPKRIQTVDGVEEYVYRPLCIYPFRDQVVEVALLSLFGNRFELGWGDTELDKFPELVSYGNRLHLVGATGHREFSVGNARIYRDWSDDYSKFVRETERHFNKSLKSLAKGQQVVLICTDVKSFYPSVDRTRLIRMLRSESKRSLWPLIGRVLGEYEVNSHIADYAQLDGLAQKGLPQGPAHSGFLANVYLSPFDDWITTQFEARLRRIDPKCKVEFYARYVDDMRILVRCSSENTTDIIAKTKSLVQRKLSPLGLDLSLEKTNEITQSSSGTLLSTGHVAERMQAIAKKAYFPLPPEDLDELAKEVRLLFHAEARNPKTATVPIEANPILDNPGVRPDSRRRFAANKWAQIMRDLETLKPCSVEDGQVFSAELVRVWLEDPGQVQLLHKALEVGIPATDFGKIVCKLNALKNQPAAFGYYAYVLAYLLELASFGRSRINFRPLPLTQLAKEVSKRRWQHAILVNKAQQYLLKQGQPPLQSEMEHLGECRDNFWKIREGLEKQTEFEYSLHEQEMVAVLTAIAFRPKALKEAFSALLRPCGSRSREKIIRALLCRNPQLAVELAQTNNVNCIELEAFDNLLNLPNARLKESRVFRRIRNGDFRSPLSWIRFGMELAKFVKDSKNRRYINRGLMNPFALEFSQQDALSVVRFDCPMLSFVGYTPSSKKPVLRHNTSVWALPAGLLLRAAATARPIDLLGMGSSARFSLAGTFKALLRCGAKMPKGAGDIVDKLFTWPGSLIKGYRSLRPFVRDLASLERQLRGCSVDGKTICDVPWVSPKNMPGRSGAFNLVICQVPSYPNQIDDASIRRSLAISQIILRQKAQDARTVDLIVFPELSLPLKSIGTLARFVHQTKTFVLAGLELRTSADGLRSLNELMWIVPMERDGESVAILTQEKIHITQGERNLIPPVVEASPAVIWRIGSEQPRLAAINCYEFTDLLIRDLLRGRVEALVIASNNQDVTTFDNLVESTHFDLFSHVVLVNAERYGGSAVRAPYKKPHERRIFDIHGNNLFAVNVCTLDLRDFRRGLHPGIKSPPAGFLVKP